VFVHMCVHIRECVYVCADVTYTHAFALNGVVLCVHACVWVCVYVCVFVCVCVCVRARVRL